MRHSQIPHRRAMLTQGGWRRGAEDCLHFTGFPQHFLLFECGSIAFW